MVTSVSICGLQKQSNEGKPISNEHPNDRDFILKTRVHTTKQYKRGVSWMTYTDDKFCMWKVFSIVMHTPIRRYILWTLNPS